MKTYHVVLCISVISLVAACSQHDAQAKSNAEGPDKAAALAATGTGRVILTSEMMANLAAVGADPMIRSLKSNDSGDDGAFDLASIEPMVAKIEARPEAVKALARHGFTPRTYVSDLMTLMQTVVAARVPAGPARQKLIGDATVDPANIAFLNAHRPQVSEVFSAGMDPTERAKTEREIAALHAMKPGMIGECMKVSVATIPLTSLTIRGSGAISSSDAIKIADGSAAIAAKLNDPRPKNDFADIATEIRLHAAERPIDSPKMEAAITDIRDWTVGNCMPSKPGE